MIWRGVPGKTFLRNPSQNRIWRGVPGRDITGTRAMPGRYVARLQAAMVVQHLA
jgi:hypothetical protein